MSRREKPSPYNHVPRVPDAVELSINELVAEGETPIELEIGFGKGQFILDRALGDKASRFIGVETRKKWVDLVMSRAAKRGLKNVSLWHGDIRTLLPRIKEDGCLKRVFINFPDPWWKLRHMKRMVVTEDLVLQIARLLEDGGELFIQTDVDDRAVTYYKILSAESAFKPREGETGWILENPFYARSLRELRCIDEDLVIHRLFFIRRPRIECKSPC
jgi:tRNA (guanine-N7-)-methyltransferase